MSMTLTLNGTTQKAVRAGVQDYINDAIKILSEKYGFDANEATDEITFKINFAKNKELKGVEGTRDGDGDAVKPNAKLIPWTGQENADWCAGILVNHQLYTQCTKARCDDNKLCGPCADQAEKNGTGKPDHGMVEDRLANGLFDYMSPKTGKSAVRFSTYMAKNDIPRDAVTEECAKWGLTVPDEIFEIHKAKRGRPPSADKANNKPDGPKRGRGRPKSEKKMVKGGSDDLIAELVAQANKIKENAPAEPAEPEHEIVQTTSFASPPASPEPKKKTAPKKKRNTPKKKAAEVAITNDTGSEAEVETEKPKSPEPKKKAGPKKKAAPKKKEPTPEPEPQMELVADPYEQDTESEGSDDDGPELLVEKWTCPADDNEYLLDKNSLTVYDINTHDEVGTWNESEQTIM